MILRYEIKSCHRTKFAAVAEIAGKPQDVEIPGLVIEALSEDGSMGHTFRLRGTAAELDAAEARAADGGALLVTLQVTDGKRPVSLAEPVAKAEPEASGEQG